MSQIFCWFSSLYEGFFSTIPLILPPPQKPTFQFNLKTVDKKSHFVECPMLNSISIIIIIIAILNIIILKNGQIMQLLTEEIYLFRDPHDTKRTATSLSWYPDSSGKLAVAYSILEFQQFAGETSMDSYIWDIGKNLFEELQLF